MLKANYYLEIGQLETKPTNPKDAIGSEKLPVHLWPETATMLGCLGLLDGALKYGRSNYRAIGVRASIYYDAVRRHTTAWFEGEDIDPDSGLPHLAHALASLAIIVDAQAKGALNDDRMYPTDYRKWIDSLTPHVSRLKELHKDKSPHHYTRQDELLPKADSGIPARVDMSTVTKIMSTQPCGLWVYRDDSNIRCVLPKGHDGFCSESILNAK